MGKLEVQERLFHERDAGGPHWGHPRVPAHDAACVPQRQLQQTRPSNQVLPQTRGGAHPTQPLPAGLPRLEEFHRNKKPTTVCKYLNSYLKSECDNKEHSHNIFFLDPWNFVDNFHRRGVQHLPGGPRPSTPSALPPRLRPQLQEPHCEGHLHLEGEEDCDKSRKRGIAEVGFLLFGQKSISHEVYNVTNGY